MAHEPLCTDAEEATLREWNFITDFENTKQHFVDIMRGALIGAAQMGSGDIPSPEDLAEWVEVVLEKDLVFDKLVRDKRYIAPGRAYIFRRMIARYAVSVGWEEVTQ